MGTAEGTSQLSRAPRPRVLLADDHRMVAEGLKVLLSREFDVLEVVEDGRTLVEAAKRLRPEVVVADITMPQLNGIEALALLVKEIPGVNVILLTMHQEVAYARRALEAGARGYVLKHSAPAELITAVHAVLAGRSYVTPILAGKVLQVEQPGPKSAKDPAEQLTPRQREVLQLLAAGRSAKEIGNLLSISPRTVEFHKYQLMETLQLKHSAELVHFAIKHGIVDI